MAYVTANVYIEDYEYEFELDVDDYLNYNCSQREKEEAFEWLINDGVYDIHKCMGSADFVQDLNDYISENELGIPTVNPRQRHDNQTPIESNDDGSKLEHAIDIIRNAPQEQLDALPDEDADVVARLPESKQPLLDEIKVMMALVDNNDPLIREIKLLINSL